MWGMREAGLLSKSREGYEDMFRISKVLTVYQHKLVTMTEGSVLPFN